MGTGKETLDERVKKQTLITHIIGVGVSMRAVLMEIFVKLDFRRWTGLRCVMRSRTTVWTVLRVTVQIRRTGTIATDNVSLHILWTFEWVRTFIVQVDRTSGDGAPFVVFDLHGNIETINQGDVIVVVSVSCGECPLGQRSRWHAGTSVGIAFQTAIATSIEACSCTIGVREVASPTSPDSPRLPVVCQRQRLIHIRSHGIALD